MNIAGYTLTPALAQGMGQAALQPPPGAHPGQLVWLDVSPLEAPNANPATEINLTAWRSAGWQVQVLAVVAPSALRETAAEAYAEALAAGVAVQPWRVDIPLHGVVVDALLGTGLTGAVREPFAAAIGQINASNLPVLALDLPSGLCADTGAELGVAVQAELTVTFIALKLGLLTGVGPDRVGVLQLDDLHADAQVLVDGTEVTQPEYSFWFKDVGSATHYHATYVYPYWAPSLNFIGTIGAHRFYSWKGSAGRQSAFFRSYAGREPFPGPKPRAWSPQYANDLDPIALQKRYEKEFAAARLKAEADAEYATRAASSIAPNAPYAASSYSRDASHPGRDAEYTGQRLPEAAGIKPEYQNSGTWKIQPTG